MTEFPFPKSINVTYGGLEEINLAFYGNAGVQGVWQAVNVPKILSVKLETIPIQNIPGGPIVTVVKVQPKEFLPHKVGFTLVHTENPKETILVTLEGLLLTT